MDLISLNDVAFKNTDNYFYYYLDIYKKCLEASDKLCTKKLKQRKDIESNNNKSFLVASYNV